MMHLPRKTERLQGGWLLLGAVTAVAATALIAWGAFDLAPARHADAVLLAHAVRYRNGAVGGIASALASLGDVVTQVLLMTLGLATGLTCNRWKAALAAACLVLGANLTTVVLKQTLAAPRVDPQLAWVQLGPNAFPSGHATAAFAMAAAWVLIVPSSWRSATAAVGGALASGVAIAVVVLHHHYPSDVLGGFFVAAAWTCGVLAAYSAARTVWQAGSSGMS